MAMTSMGVSKKDGGEQPGSSSCPCPIPIAAVETAAIIASKASTAPLPSAPSLGNFPAPTAGSQQHARHPHALPPITQPFLTQETTPIATTKTIQQTNNTNSCTDDNNREVVLRSGKWTAEEELYANILIELFEEGRVDEFEQSLENNNSNGSKDDDEQKPQTFKISNGMTLRAYLSRKLFCSPMRISKKFAGRGIGKLVYMSGSFQGGVQQRFSFCSGRIASNRLVSLPPDVHWNKLNRLKEAESNFLKSAFPKKVTRKSDCSTVCNRSSPTQAKRVPSTKSKPEKVHIMPASSYTVHGRPQLNNQLDLGAYQSSWGKNELVHHRNICEQHCTTSGETTPAPAATNSDVQFPRPLTPQHATKTTYPPLAPFPNNEQQQQQQQQQPSADAVRSNYRTTAVPTYMQTPGASTIASSPDSLSHKQPSPLMAAPKLLSPNSIETRSDDLKISTTSRLHQLQRDPKRQRIEERTQSQIQVLKEAYFSSVSPQKPRVSQNIITNNTVLAPAKIFKNSIKDITGNAQSPTKRERAPFFDWSQPMDNSPAKTDINVPDFLSGFDKVSKPKMSSPFDQQLIENSPAYHTSRSFDDFHRFLGKGLSPTIVPGPKFPNLETATAGPAIPSIQSSSKASPSKLQMRSRNPLTMAPAIIGSSDTISSDAPTPIRKNTRKRDILSEAYAEAVRSSEGRQALQAPHAQDQKIINSSGRCIAFEGNPPMTLSQPMSYTLQETNQEGQCRPNPTQQQQHKPEESIDFPIEGMMFEDFGTLTSYSDTKSNSCSNFADRCVIEEEPSSGTGGLISDDSDCTPLEEFSRGTKGELRYTYEQPESAFERNNF